MRCYYGQESCILNAVKAQYARSSAEENEGQLIPNCRFLPIESDWGHRAGDPHRPGQEALRPKAASNACPSPTKSTTSHPHSQRVMLAIMTTAPTTTATTQ